MYFNCLYIDVCFLVWRGSMIYEIFWNYVILKVNNKINC